MFNRKYKYYVSHNFTNSKGSGFGSCEITRDKPIKSFEDMRGLLEDIKKANNLDSVVITYIYELS